MSVVLLSVQRQQMPVALKMTSIFCGDKHDVTWAPILHLCFVRKHFTFKMPFILKCFFKLRSTTEMQDPLKRRVVLMEHIVGGGDIWENLFL